MSQRSTRRAVGLVLLAAVASATAVAEPAASAAATKPRKAALDLKLEKAQVIVATNYRRLPPIGKRGQMGRNLRGGHGFSLADQQLGDLYVRAGIIREERSLIRDGFRAFDYAFRRQSKNGSLPASQTEAYAFFVEAVAHSVLLLRETRYGRAFARKLRRYVRNLRRAAPHMIASQAWADFVYRNQFYTHSAYTVGTSLAMTGALTGNGRFRRHGLRAIQMGLGRQRFDGVNPELGGHDVRYQMVGISYAERFSVYFPGTRLTPAVREMVARGILWMSGRVAENGWIDWRGSTRACRELSSTGRPKTPGYTDAIRGFAYWGNPNLVDDPDLRRQARAMKRYLRLADDLCGPREEIPTAGAARTQAERPRGDTLRGPELQDLYE